MQVFNIRYSHVYYVYCATLFNNILYLLKILKLRNKNMLKKKKKLDRHDENDIDRATVKTL